MAAQTHIYVYLDEFDTNEPVFMGVLHSEVIRGKEIFSYENDPGWLKHKRYRALDPDLKAFTGKQYLGGDKSNFGVFLDSAPDRWGRTLMRRREAINARLENRAQRTLTEADFLMGIFDGNRMGALRFAYSSDGEFMDNNRMLATPPWTAIRDLEYASLQLEEEKQPHSTDYARWLNMLIAPGSSLGGARPKANVLDESGHLWIAKFPSNQDSKDMGAWEMVVAELARSCGIVMSESRVQKFGRNHQTFLTKRFDRTNNNRRIHFASALTLLGYADGVSHSEGASYLELAEWIMANCNDPNANLEQLWRRMVFNIAVSNCDDHLRNHGFVYTPKGWQLSPAYDINPNENGMGLTLNISDIDNSLDFDLAVSVAGYFGVNKNRASDILKSIISTVAQWPQIATHYGISREEQHIVAHAFRTVK